MNKIEYVSESEMYYYFKITVEGNEFYVGMLKLPGYMIANLLGVEYTSYGITYEPKQSEDET